MEAAFCRLSDVTQPNLICESKIKDQTIDKLHKSLIKHFPCVQSCISSETQIM